MGYPAQHEDFVQDLIDRAQREPYSHIEGYMNRWWVNGPKKGPDGKYGPTARIHQILRSDNDRHLHDHPWDYTSIILRGYYIEETPIMPAVPSLRTIVARLATATADYGPGSVLQREATHCHKLTLPDGPVWTLFICGEYKQRWGFHTERGKVDWRTYLGDASEREYESTNPFK